MEFSMKGLGKGDLLIPVTAYNRGERLGMFDCI